MRRVFVAAVGVAAAGITPAFGQTYIVVPQAVRPYRGYDTLHASRAAMNGEETRVWWAQMANPDCTAAGKMTTTVVDPPRHGAVRISDDPFFASFPASNPRSACNTQKVPGKQAFYTSAAGFKGHDHFTLQNATSEGRIRKIVFDIDVR